jgi:hypothetical protein
MQLDLNARDVAEAQCEHAVESRHVVDVCDLIAFMGGEFDPVVACGGPLSDAFERVDIALSEMFRVTVRGGPVVGSVMSTWAPTDISSQQCFRLSRRWESRLPSGS